MERAEGYEVLATHADGSVRMRFVLENGEGLIITLPKEEAEIFFAALRPKWKDN